MVIINKNQWCVYTHSFNGVIFYIGKGRSYRPFEESRRNTAWCKFMSDKDHFEVDIINWFTSEHDALLFEAQFIRDNKTSCNLMMNGYTHSDDTKVRIGLGNKNKVVSTMTRGLIRNTRKMLGLKPPLSKKGRSRKGTPIVCNETGIVFSSTGEASRILKIPKTSIKGHLKGDLRHAGGFTFLRFGHESPIKGSYGKRCQMKREKIFLSSQPCSTRNQKKKIELFQSPSSGR